MEQSYIIRVFSRQGSDLAHLVGVLEDPLDGQRHPFHGGAELLELLCEDGGRPRRPDPDPSGPAG